MPRLYHECGERHVRPHTPAWERPPSPARRPSGGPLHAPAADVRRAVLGVLASWAGLTVRETGSRPPRRTVAELCAFLHGHLALLVRHPAAGELAAEVTALRDRAERVARPGEARRVVVGTCREAGCGGTLTARPARDRRQPARVRCEADPAHSWSGPEFLSPVRRPGPAGHPPPGRGTDAAGAGPEGAPRESAAGGTPDGASPAGPTGPGNGPRWLSPAEITALWGVPSGSVYRLAGEHGWTRRRGGRRVRYAAEEVLRTLAPRGA
ncbi:hypothetical protein [Streptomyces zingiberis]|uniref:DNA-binding protein n=1 Tax=Streptomyces zingiberis TaxID=2053010 RepID=A0ABX1C7Y9_9ACTN|nr:hypothetical protein [Streptomyces zingiberis]NJQ03819.1 hypothetical protein [Streptomyces zingiberis]